MLPRLLLTILAFSLASPALADAVIYEGTLGTARIIVELSAPPETARSVVGRYAYMNKGIDIPLDAVIQPAGRLDLIEEKPCTIKLCHTDDNGDPKGPAPVGAKWNLAPAKEGATVIGTWSSGGKVLKLSLTRVATRPLPADFDGTPAGLEAIVLDLASGQQPVTAQVSPYDYTRLTEGPVQPGAATTWPGGGFQYITDLRTKFPFPAVTGLNGDDVAPVNAYLSARHAQLNADALSCEARQFQGLGWNEMTAEAVGTLGGYEDEQVTVTYLSPTLVSWNESGSLFCGGAHPDNHDTPYTLDVRAGKLLDLSLIFKGWVPTPIEDGKPTDLATARAHPEDYQWGPDKALADFVTAHLPADIKTAETDSDPGCGAPENITGNLAISFLAGDRVRFSLANMPNVAAVCDAPLFDLPIAEVSPLLTPGAKAYFPGLGGK